MAYSALIASMQTSYNALLRQIKSLETQAAALKKKEAAAAIARIREAIATYGLTQQELFGPGRADEKRARRGAGYRDERGNTWSGWGRRPAWFEEALASGKTLDDLLVDKGRATQKARAAARGKDRRAAGFTDGTNSWSGRGRRPGWFTKALAAGKSAEEMRL